MDFGGEKKKKRNSFYRYFLLYVYTLRSIPVFWPVSVAMLINPHSAKADT